MNHELHFYEQGLKVENQIVIEFQNSQTLQIKHKLNPKKKSRIKRKNFNFNNEIY
jgi:hypothetical protein